MPAISPSVFVLFFLISFSFFYLFPPFSLCHLPLSPTFPLLLTKFHFYCLTCYSIVMHFCLSVCLSLCLSVALCLSLLFPVPLCINLFFSLSPVTIALCFKFCRIVGIIANRQSLSVLCSLAPSFFRHFFLYSLSALSLVSLSLSLSSLALSLCLSLSLSLSVSLPLSSLYRLINIQRRFMGRPIQARGYGNRQCTIYYLTTVNCSAI